MPCEVFKDQSVRRPVLLKHTKNSTYTINLLRTLQHQTTHETMSAEERKEKFLEGLAERLTCPDLRSELEKAEHEKLFTDDEMEFITEKLLKLDKSDLETSIAELEIPGILAPVDDTAGHPVGKPEIEDDEKEVDVDEFVKYLFEELYHFVEKEEEVKLDDFAVMFVAKAAEGFPTTVLNVNPMLHKDAASAINSTKNQQVFTDFEQRPDYIRVVRSRKSGFTGADFRRPLFKSAVDIYFEKYIGDEEALRKHLMSGCYPIKDGDFGKKIRRKAEDKSTEEQVTRLPANLDYVEVDVDGGNIFSTKGLQADKRYAIVVTGESGSGKTTYSIGKVLEQEFLPVYCAIPPPSSSTTSRLSKTVPLTLEEEVEEKPKTMYRSLSSFLELVSLCFEQVRKEDTKVERLYTLKGKLNKDRDDWATRVLDAAMRKVVGNGHNERIWLEGKWSSQVLPKKVAVIIDEATDIDLAAGLVSTVRRNISRYLGRVAKKEFLILVVGTGLDVIKATGRVGTNPSHSKLVYVKNPKIDTVVKDAKLSDAVLEAINEGLFARVMKTNARMFFRAVLPILTLPMHKIDDDKLDKAEKERRLRDRLVKVASFQPLMDYAARMFVSQNSVGEFATDERNDLLKNAFLYHWKCAIEGVKCEEVKRRELEHIPPSAINEDIFTRGIASREGTSAALKYLSCFGLTCEVKPGYGDDFEELTALHVMRVMESQGYEPFRCQLKHAWPPARPKGDISQHIEDLRTDILPEQDEKEVEFERIPGNARCYCIVFNQGTSNAQAGDLFVLKVNGTEAKLDTIQCKNCKAAGDKEKWWNSLGVAIDTEDTQPVEGSAGYSYCGLEAFCKLASRRLEMDVQIDSRIMAVSSECPDTFQLPKSKKLRWWFREMLEPTISVLPPRSPSGENDVGDDDENSKPAGLQETKEEAKDEQANAEPRENVQDEEQDGMDVETTREKALSKQEEPMEEERDKDKGMDDDAAESRRWISKRGAKRKR